MPSKIRFAQATIQKVGFDLDGKTNQVIVELSMKASWTAKVRERMGWGEIPEWEIGPAVLKGELVGTQMTLVPSDDKLSSEEFSIPIHYVGDFKAYRVKDGEGTKTILKFTIKTRADDAEALSGAYLRRVGNGSGELEILYERQMELGEQQETAE